MKPLYEVIEELKHSSGLVICSKKKYDKVVVKLDLFQDAMEYLKMFREISADPAAFMQWKENQPLSWDELKDMEGKPVFLEILSDEVNIFSRYMLVGKQKENGTIPMVWSDDMIHWIFLHEDENGKIMQAYRKERE